MPKVWYNTHMKKEMPDNAKFPVPPVDHGFWGPEDWYDWWQMSGGRLDPNPHYENPDPMPPMSFKDSLQFMKFLQDLPDIDLATKEAKSNPEVAALYDQRDAIQKDIRDAKKILGEGPQSGVARIAKHTVWIEKINAEMAQADDALDSSEAALAEIDSSIGKKVQALTKTSQENSIEA